MYKFILGISITISGHLHAADFSTQKQQCLNSAKIVMAKDYAAFKAISPKKVAHEDEAIRRYVDKVHKKYTQRRYKGIKNFKVYDATLIREPQNERSYTVRNAPEKWNASQVLLVAYTFDTTTVKYNKQQTIKGKCQFGLINNNWYIT